MAGGHAHKLYVHGHSVIHRMPAHCKLVALVSFVLVVVSTTRTAYWAFGAFLVLLGIVAIVARVPPFLIVRRMVVETPFVVFAILLPFVATGPRINFLGLSVSEAGLLGGWNVLAKATLGVIASILLAATTDQRALLAGLEKLRLPQQLVQITAFMIRYADVISGQVSRMRIARLSRGFQPTSVKGWPVLAKSAGSLFIRSYERGERVHLAMLSRGYNGKLPALADSRGGSGGGLGVDWARAVSFPLCALLIAILAWWTI